MSLFAIHFFCSSLIRDNSLFDFVLLYQNWILLKTLDKDDEVSTRRGKKDEEVGVRCGRKEDSLAIIKKIGKQQFLQTAYV